MMFWQALTAEARYVWQRPWDRALVSWLPLLVLCGLMWLFVGGLIVKLPVALVDDDHSALSRQIARTLSASSALQITAQPPTLAGAQSLIRSGKVFAIIYVPHNAELDRLRGNTATVFSFYNNSFYTAGGAVNRGIGSAISQLNSDLSPLNVLVVRENEKSPLSASPIGIHAVTLYNSRVSYEFGLIPIVYSCFIHLLMLCAVVSALARPFRQGATPDPAAGSWSALSGKIGFYVLAYTALHSFGLLGFMGWRSWHMEGSLVVLLLAQLLMYVDYALIGLLFVGLAKGDILRALSFSSFFAGPAMAYSDALFPTVAGAGFVRFWSMLMPVTSYLRVQLQQIYQAAPAHDALPHFGVMLLFVLVLTWPAKWLFGKALQGRVA